MPAAQTVDESDNAKAVLSYLERHFASHDFPPSRKEIADALGISTGTVQRWLIRLAARGAIKMESNTARAIRLNRTGSVNQQSDSRRMVEMRS